MTNATSRDQLAAVLRTAGDLVRVEDAAKVLGVSRHMAAKSLARWVDRRWLKRLRRGLYAPIPLSLTAEENVLEDPWTLVPELFAPGYIGGATAAHHWDLTEQIFRTVFVYTTRHVRAKEETIQSFPFRLRHIGQDRMFGTSTLWRGRTKILLSDVHRTVVDLVDDPSAGGGIRHVAGCFESYLRAKEADLSQVLDYAERFGNGAVFKRLGFLGERFHAPADFLEACARRLTKGNAKLDPTLPAPRLVKRWRLAVPDNWKDAPSHD
ncbi:MAG: type IV toxin-antitoxin system AbiEi family antitoxin domain-containing protein [Edaphobacter sp.]